MSEAEPTAEPPAEPFRVEVAVEFKHSRPLTCCHWEPLSRYVFFGAEDHLVHRYDLADGTVISLAHHDSWVRDFASSPDGATVYSAGFDGVVACWPIAGESPQPLRVIPAHDGWVRAVAASACGKFLATCGNDRLVKLWDAADGRLIREYSGHEHHVYNVIFLPDSSQLVSCDLKGFVRAWQVDSEHSKPLATVAQLHDYDTTFRADIGGARGIAVHPDGGLVGLGGITKVTNAFAGVGDVAVALVHTDSGEVVRVLESKEAVKGTIWGVAYHPGGYWVGVSAGGGGGWLHFWDGQNDHEFAKVKLKFDGRGMSLSPDLNRIAVAHADSHLRIHELTDQRPATPPAG
ncbi:MAG: hypothetical protein EA381_06865 [Planctomycetaceae bacterium]|nr:MAG: hypothetical protein EA381_06865 [Planctomycetaceae bacterium]